MHIPNIIMGYAIAVIRILRKAAFTWERLPSPMAQRKSILVRLNGQYMSELGNTWIIRIVATQAAILGEGQASSCWVHLSQIIGSKQREQPKAYPLNKKDIWPIKGLPDIKKNQAFGNLLFVEVCLMKSFVLQIQNFCITNG